MPGTAEARARRKRVRDFYTSKIRLAVVLVLCFAVLPSFLLLAIGVLVLAMRTGTHDIVFGILIVSFAATLIAGVTFTFLFIRRSTSLARLQTEFVQKVSHDLRTPLTSIRLFVETLQSGKLSTAEVQESLEVLSDETARLAAMVERLLRWASMEAGRRIYEPVPVAPATIVEAALAAVEPQVKLARLQGTVDVHTEVADALPQVEVDVMALTEALINVLQNALRYTGAQKEIRVRAQMRDGEVEISVGDNGPGISKHEQRYIFEKFYRAVDPAKPNVEGSGLGLAIVHRVVAAHGGSVSVESELGRGAVFRLLLPVARDEAPAVAAARAKAAATTSEVKA